MVAERAPLRITGARTKVVRLPLDPPLTTSIHNAPFIDHVLLSLETDAGRRGIGHLFAFGDLQARAIEATLQDLLAVVVGTEISDPEASWERLLQRINFLGRSGIAMMAVAAVDTATWDLWAQRSEIPLWAALGARRPSPLPCYASDTLWLGDPLASLASSTRKRAELGFQEIKVRIGAGPDEDQRRVEAVVNAVPGMSVMADANQGWRRDQALEMAARLGGYGLKWLEEPVDMDDLDGLRAVVDASPTPIATGESWYGPREIGRGLEAAGFRYLMPDLQRAGGVTGWMRAARMAAEQGRTVSPHLFPEVSIHLLSALDAPGPVEYVPWYRDLFAQAPAPAGGRLQAGDRPGLGLEFRTGLLD